MIQLVIYLMPLPDMLLIIQVKGTLIKVPLISTKLAHNIFNKNIYLTLI